MTLNVSVVVPNAICADSAPVADRPTDIWYRPNTQYNNIYFIRKKIQISFVKMANINFNLKKTTTLKTYVKQGIPWHTPHDYFIFAFD